MLDEKIKVLIIDDSERGADFLCESFSCESVAVRKKLFSEGDDIRTLAEKIIQSEFAESNSILFININLILGNQKRQSHKGLELLTWLRIKGCMSHCVLYSFQSAEAILRTNERNRLLFSKGTTYVQLPNDFANINLSDLVKDEAKNNDLKANIKPLFNYGKFRHRDANWWGVKQLWDVHRIATAGKFRDDYPPCVKQNLTSLNNAVGVFLNELEHIDLANLIEKTLNNIDTETVELENQIRELRREKVTKDEDLTDFKTIINNLHKQIKKIDKEIQIEGKSKNQDSSTEQDELLEEIKSYEEGRKEARQISTVLQQQIDLWKSRKQSISNVYNTLKQKLFAGVEIPVVENTPKILLIDDNAKNGWKDIFSKILNTNYIEAPDFDESYKDRLDDFYEDIVKPNINPDELDLILLDLRLFDETDPSTNVNNLSGKLLLEKIRKDFKGVPIVITTASNKIWTYQKLMQLGADAYWIKEGLDEQREAKETVENYRQLIFLVAKLTDGRYKLLRKFANFAQKFELDFIFRGNPHWSNIGDWADGRERTGRVEKISESLNNSVLVIKTYLHNYHLRYGFKDELNESFVLSGLINKIAGVFEDVHDLKEGDGISGNYIRKERDDEKGFRLYQIRAKQSHSWFNAKWETLEDGIKKTMIYLEKGP